jgi:hypothetical protein
MKKSKWDIIGSDLDREIDFVYDDWFCYWYDGEDYFDYGYGVDYEYDYIGTIYKDYVSKRGIRLTFERFNMGSYIDMMSIYSKSEIRQIKIDYLLGVNNNKLVKKSTLSDIIKIKKGQ